MRFAENGETLFPEMEDETVIREIEAPYTISPIQTLSNLDWDFAKAKTTYLTHGIHPYPAKYIPQIPNALIQELSSVEETVADIFCGSGTTLVEALTLKRNAIGVDANPLACLISRAKTTRLAEGDAEVLRSLIERGIRQANSILAFSVPNLFNEEGFKSEAPRPEHKIIANWFEPYFIEELAEILSWCRGIASETAKTLALTAFSSIVVAVSKQESDTRYARVEKNLTHGEAFRKFARALNDILRFSEEYTEIVEPRFTCSIIPADILSKPDIGLVDLVVCSPPYPNAYSYHLYHASRMIWLGMDQPKFKQEEIGSHRKYSSKSIKGATIETFRQEMSIIFSWLKLHLRNGKYACFVIGDSTIKAQRYNNADVLIEAAQPYGFTEVARISRRMQDTKKAFNPAIGKIKDEYILILQKNRSISQ
ncbi:hypothetical protein A9Q02_21245 [Candidatus Chloroploca asiatica]|uniref:DNA methylase N-4/N-6 domain-containing protein n=1 Tax=Candidatus Chloroploca asiatica TaxID=1506545 RepID=A0A2H3KRM6_9CHLR|nr:hypothetical protein A9Q02_21245 [Candidatus Chloroploca asiatica]